MSAVITVNQASEFTKKREKMRREQQRVTYTDLVIYVKCANPKQLSECSAITNVEEWALDIGTESSEKLSMVIVSENDNKFTLITLDDNSTTTKPDMVETPLSKSAFDRLKTIGAVGYAYRRHRYDIPYTDNTWTADVFTDSLGNDHPWVRLRLTVVDPESSVPSIPFIVEDFIYEKDAKESPKHAKVIENLWRHEWTTLEN